jgi:hypothetical protein
MKANIKLSQYKLSPVQLLALTNNVLAKMTGNPVFASPAVPLANLQAVATAYKAAIEEATAGSRQSKLRRDDLTRQLRALLSTQADYVRTVCGGDRTKLESSGFELAKQREPIGIPGISKELQVRMTGRTKEVELVWRSVHGAHGYQVWMTSQDPANGGTWQAVGYTTRVRHVITELESYRAYWFCVSAIGTAGEGMRSDPALGRAA